MKHTRRWPQKPKTKKSTSELLCTFSMHTSSGMLKANKSTLMFGLQCRDLLSQQCGTGFYCNPLLVTTVCCMYQLPFLTYKSRFIVLQDEVSVVAIVAGHLEMQQCNREVRTKGLISLCPQTQVTTSQACTTTACFI